MGTAIFKVSVLDNGSVLLNSERVTLQELALAFDARRQANSAVWYYRENAAGDGPPVTAEVMKLIIERRLPIRLSTKPDFSDSVTAQATGSFFEKGFAAVRERAKQRQLVVVRSDGKLMTIPAMERAALPARAVAAVEGLLPSSTPGNVAAIADTSWATAGSVNLADAGKAIPFLGLLMGFAGIGHAVWIFGDATATRAALAAGCRDADLLLVDSDLLSGLPGDWRATAEPSMRHPRIVVHDRRKYPAPGGV